jgi:hypothetical protein
VWSGSGRDAAGGAPQSLSHADVEQIADRMLLELKLRVLASSHIHLQVSAHVKERLVKDGFNPAEGARPLRRALAHWVESPLAEYMLEHHTTHEHSPGEGATGVTDGIPARFSEEVLRRSPPVRAGTCLVVDVDDGAVGASSTEDGVVRQDEQRGSSVIREATAMCELDVELHGQSPSSNDSNITEAGISAG